MSVHYYFADGAWVKMRDCKVRVNGAWKQCEAIYTFRGGYWRMIWPITTVYLSAGSLSLSLTDVASGGAAFLKVLEDADITITTKPYVEVADQQMGTSDWVIPEGSTLVLYLVDSKGRLATTDGSYCGAIFTRESDNTLKFAGCPGTNVEGGKILHGIYSWVVGTKEVVDTFGVKGLPFSTGFEWLSFNLYSLNNVTAVSSEILAKPFYPYFASTGTQHTTGISLIDTSVLQDLVIRRYSSYSADGEELDYGYFKLTQTGNGSGECVFSIHQDYISILYTHDWTVNSYGADTAVLTSDMGEKLWWDGTQRVDSVTLSIN